MGEFLVELYGSRADGAALASSARSARLAAEELTREGSVQYMRSIFGPEDETCFLLYAATTAADVEEAARRASLPFDHVALAIAGREAEWERP